MPSRRGAWRTKFGFYLVAIGSALSLGNLWRFPYVAGENGGGAFVLLYLFLALVIGMPLLIGELILGKSTGQSVLRATAQLAAQHKSWMKWAGRFSVILSLVVLSYYSVISGWVLHFLSQFFWGLFSSQEISYDALKNLLSNGFLQWILSSMHLLIALFVVTKGVHEGIEKWIVSIMPFFALLMVILVSQTMSLPSAPEVLRFLFYPDFSKLTSSSLIHAIGHVFFTLSLGFGTMVTFGSYMNQRDHVSTAGFRVTLMDTLVSLTSGFLIFPIVFHGGNIHLKDPALLFEALPTFLAQTKWGVFFGLVFFLGLYLAALNASIGLLETVLSNLLDFSKGKMQRTKAAWATGAAAVILAVLPSFSSSQFGSWRVGGSSLLEFLDGVLINWCLPLVALFLVICVRKGLSEQEKALHFKGDDIFVSHVMYSHWQFAIKWLAPLTIGLGLLLQAWGALRG